MAKIHHDKLLNIRAFASAGVAAAALMAAATPAQAVILEDRVYTGIFSNVAVEGYDPVAYFTEGEPVKGSKKYATDYHGAEFRFASQENLDKFLADPEKYAPQYGGYCAWAVAQGKFAKGDAENWAIVDGKLYLNYNDDIQEKWDSDRATFIEDGDGQWPQMIGEDAAS